MQLSEIQTLVGNLTNDPNHDRYTLSDINTELDNTQDDWNIEIGVITDTVTIATVAGTRQYAISGLTGTPILFRRATHKGLPLKKRGKAYFDLFAGGTDWTTLNGTPTDYMIEGSDPDSQYIDLQPTPQGNDAGSNLVVEYIKRHTSMSASTDVPFMSVTSSNTMLRPYDWYLCYDVSSRLLSRDPSTANAKKSDDYKKVANTGKANLIQVFKAMEKETPMRIRPERYGVRRRISR